MQSQLTNFKEVSTENITRYINNEPNKYCSQVDPLPTELIKKNIDILGPIFTNIVNKSISSGSVPQAYKEAVVIPIIKNKTLEPTFANFKACVQPFIFKIMDKVVSEQINAFTDSHNLDEPLQSALKKNCSTETVLVKVQNDILLCID